MGIVLSLLTKVRVNKCVFNSLYGTMVTKSWLQTKLDKENFELVNVSLTAVIHI